MPKRKRNPPHLTILNRRRRRRSLLRPSRRDRSATVLASPLPKPCIPQCRTGTPTSRLLVTSRELRVATMPPAVPPSPTHNPFRRAPPLLLRPDCAPLPILYEGLRLTAPHRAAHIGIGGRRGEAAEEGGRRPQIEVSLARAGTCCGHFRNGGCGVCGSRREAGIIIPHAGRQIWSSMWIPTSTVIPPSCQVLREIFGGRYYGHLLSAKRSCGGDRSSWLIDCKRMASKIKNASVPTHHISNTWKSNPTKECPKCNHIIDNSDFVDEWPGLPKGVKFDPSDQELLWHLLAKIGKVGLKPDPFIDEFIPTIDSNEGLYYTHPQKLPGVKQDGSVSHFFHRTFKAYNTGTKKRRKINTNEVGGIRWNKTGKTKQVLTGGTHLGSKKIMVMYASDVKGGKQKKTNWVMHQYHIGTGEDEKDGEFVVSKLFYQQLPKPKENNSQGITAADALEPVCAAVDLADCPPSMDLSSLPLEEDSSNQEIVGKSEHNCDQVHGHNEVKDREDILHHESENVVIGNQDKHPSQDEEWWEEESQFLLNSQQLAECMSICDEFLQSQNSCGSGDEPQKSRSRLAEYGHLPADDLKKDLEECQKMDDADNTNLELECSQEFRLSQLDCFNTTWIEGTI